MTVEKDYLELKWGSVKGWNLVSEAALLAVEKYLSQPVSMSAMFQRDTPEQKAALLELIDAIDGNIYLSWDGKYVSKEEAKTYVTEYGN